MCAGLLRKVSIFRKCDQSFISSILPHLQHEVYQEGDVIVQQNGPGDRMFLIEHGQVLVESLEKELCDGDHFGGQAALVKKKSFDVFVCSFMHDVSHLICFVLPFLCLFEVKLLELVIMTAAQWTDRCCSSFLSSSFFFQ